MKDLAKYKIDIRILLKIQQRDRKYEKDLIYMNDVVTSNIYIRVPEHVNRKKKWIRVNIQRDNTEEFPELKM